MSQMTALRSPRNSSRPAAGPARPHLRIVAPADTPATGGVGFAIGCMLLLVCGLVGVLLLNTVRAQQSFTLDKLQTKSQVLSDQQQSLGSRLQHASAPQQLALQATDLGMRPAAKVRYVRASDGKVLGVAKADTKGAPFTVGTLPTTPASRAAGGASAAASAGVVEVKKKAHKTPTKTAKDSKKKAHQTSKGKDAKTSKATDEPPHRSADKAGSKHDSSSKKTTKTKR